MVPSLSSTTAQRNQKPERCYTQQLDSPRAAYFHHLEIIYKQHIAHSTLYKQTPLVPKCGVPPARMNLPLPPGTVMNPADDEMRATSRVEEI